MAKNIRGNFWEIIKAFFIYLGGLLFPRITEKIISPEEKPIDNPKEKEQEKPKYEWDTYKWDTIESVKESIQIIAMEEGVDPELAVRVAQCESGCNPNAKNTKGNYPKESIDRGLYMWNNFYHQEITDDMAYNPAIATRLFCEAVRNGHLSWWNSSKRCWVV